jgi:WhiB family redox-sensing transcriptional regulator
VQEPRNWVYDSACRDEVFPELFFPRTDDEAGITDAKSVCSRCPARTACLEWALDNNMSVGIWGGTTPQERRALKRKRSVA